MASGRLLNNKISKSKQVWDLGSYESRLAFTWLIPFADREGRTYGDPAIVRSMVFPRAEDITIKQMAEFIQGWHDAKLIIWYEVDGDKYIQFPKFAENQPNLRYDREAPSVIPPPPGIVTDNGSKQAEPMPDAIRSNAGLNPDQIPVNLTEVNRTEVNKNRTEKPESGQLESDEQPDSELEVVWEKVKNIHRNNKEYPFVRYLDELKPHKIIDSILQIDCSGEKARLLDNRYRSTLARDLSGITGGKINDVQSVSILEV